MRYQTTTPQHILRETQQQRLVRPGQQQFMTYDNDENQFIPSLVAPHRQSFDAGCTSSYGVMAPQHQHQHSYSFSGSMNAIMPVDPNFPGNNDFDFFAPNAAMTPTFMEFFAESGIQDVNSQPGSANHSRRSSRSISGVILDRVAQFENLALKSPERPLTPPNQDSSNYFPPTPLDSPFNRTIKQEHIPRRFREDYDTSMEETIKPKNNRRAKTVFDEMRQEAEMKAAPSPPRSGPMPSSSTFDSAPMPTSNFLNMSNMNLDFLKNDPQFPQPQFSPTSSNVSHDVSYPSSPEQSQAKSFRDPFTNRPILEATEASYSLPSYHNGLPISNAASSSPVQSAYRRSESVSSINLEESITDTGITIDDIATYIQAPDPGDTRWLCLYPDCGKRFGRKENIKSHVQTHLGDRQFQCPHCHKCFVRQHDLKRHAKIHSGVKPYPCQCGNSFARHDALTRHRQRGMCIGAFEGVVKKTVKRGRPRKNRPDDEERITKSSRTRSKNKNISSTSSCSEYSESTSAHSPRSEIDLLDSKSFSDYEYSQSSSLNHGGLEYVRERSSSIAASSITDCVSPRAIQPVRVPITLSAQSSFSERLPSRAPSSSKSSQSNYSPPALCESSSSPATSNNLYDLDAVSNSGELSSLPNITEQDDMFLEAFAAAAASNGMSQLERDPDLLMGKFDSMFSAATENDEMFRSEEDVFFGSP
ncbi:c2h2 transcription factor swi5 protein [Rutstroemia sp. NJR-2017a BVV2]|nr:c2h2 transcription factor swi5 protein [Rutstroemia sp. NJR-2017a BVV2]